MPELARETPARRRPGLAVLIILLYAAAFGAGLLWFRSRSPLFHRNPSVAPSPTITPGIP